MVGFTDLLIKSLVVSILFYILLLRINMYIELLFYCVNIILFVILNCVDICGVITPSRMHYDQHIRGKKHIENERRHRGMQDIHKQQKGE